MLACRCKVKEIKKTERNKELGRCPSDDEISKKARMRNYVNVLDAKRSAGHMVPVFPDFVRERLAP